MKIEPMSVERMRLWVQHCFHCDEPNHPEVLSAILSWIHAEARAREGDWGAGPGCPSRDKLIAVIKREVGWVEDL